MMGEDIVLTYRLLELGYASSYEPAAVGYTRVPETLGGLYRQRRRWAMGMLEGLREVPPWRQRGYARYFTSVNMSIGYLDLVYLFGFVPGVILALFGYYYLVGLLTVGHCFSGPFIGTKSGWAFPSKTRCSDLFCFSCSSSWCRAPLPCTAIYFTLWAKRGSGNESKGAFVPGRSAACRRTGGGAAASPSQRSARWKRPVTM